MLAVNLWTFINISFIKINVWPAQGKTTKQAWITAKMLLTVHMHLPDTVDFVNKSALLCELSNEKTTAARWD